MLLHDLQNYCPGAIPMHMPGHKRNTALAPYLAALGADMDITEIDGFDDLHAPEGILKESMCRAARLWGSDESVYLVGGSTCGLLSAVYALSGNGGEAIVARNCHKSVYHALEITGLKPHYLFPETDLSRGVCGRVTAESVEKALESVPGARFVLITSPTYEGVLSDVKEICRIAHEKNVPVIVDEAHGAHLGLFDVFPEGAVNAGADIVIQSLHKTLPCLTQTAIAHLNGARVDRRAFMHALDIFETSSPSYLLMASIDGCVRLMEEKGRKILSDWMENLGWFYEEARLLRCLRVENRAGSDPGKLVVETSDAGLSGFELINMLRTEFRIELEMALPGFALAMTGAGDTRESIAALLSALKVIDARLMPVKGKPIPTDTCIPEAVFSPREALSAEAETVNVQNAVGRVSAEYAWAYPPGIPLIVPGERVPEDFPKRWKALCESGAKTLTTSGNEDGMSVIRERL